MDCSSAAFTNKLTAELNKIVKGAGVVIEVHGFEEAKGGGWSAVFDTEYAALKAFYAYRNAKPNAPTFGKAANGGWYLSLRWVG